MFTVPPKYLNKKGFTYRIGTRHARVLMVFIGKKTARGAPFRATKKMRVGPLEGI